MSITHGSIYPSVLAIISESVYPRRPHLAFTQRSKAKQHHCTNQNAPPHRNSVGASRQDFGIAARSRNIVLRHPCIVNCLWLLLLRCGRTASVVDLDYRSAVGSLPAVLEEVPACVRPQIERRAVVP